MSNGEQPQQQERYMPSIFPECDKLKQAYDKCFTTFFQQFINPDYRHDRAQNPCKELYDVYKECVERNLILHKPYDVDLDELRKEALSTASAAASEGQKTSS